MGNSDHGTNGNPNVPSLGLSDTPCEGGQNSFTPHLTRFRRRESGGVQWFRGGLVFEAHRLLYHSA